jgi:hypothetical protein
VRQQSNLGNDLETGGETELGGGVFPVEPRRGDERDAYADAMQTSRLMHQYLMLNLPRHVEVLWPPPGTVQDSKYLDIVVVMAVGNEVWSV